MTNKNEEQFLFHFFCPPFGHIKMYEYIMETIKNVKVLFFICMVQLTFGCCCMNGIKDEYFKIILSIREGFIYRFKC